MAGEHEFCWEEAVRRLGAEEKIPETLADMTEMTWLIWLRSIMNDCAIFKPMNMNCMNMPGLYIGVHHFIFMMAALPIDIH